MHRFTRKGSNSPKSNMDYSNRIISSTHSNKGGHYAATKKTLAAYRYLLRMKRSESLAWIIVIFQFLIIMSNRRSWSSLVDNENLGRGIRRVYDSYSNANSPVTTASDPKLLIMNDHTFEHYETVKAQNYLSKPFYDIATIHAEKAGLVSRVWHSNGSPSVNPNLQTGSCWCSADQWSVQW